MPGRASAQITNVRSVGRTLKLTPCAHCWFNGRRVWVSNKPPQRTFAAMTFLLHRRTQPNIFIELLCGRACPLSINVYTFGRRQFRQSAYKFPGRVSQQEAHHHSSAPSNGKRFVFEPVDSLTLSLCHSHSWARSSAVGGRGFGRTQ